MFEIFIKKCPVILKSVKESTPWIERSSPVKIQYFLDVIL